MPDMLIRVHIHYRKKYRKGSTTSFSLSPIETVSFTERRREKEGEQIKDDYTDIRVGSELWVCVFSTARPG